MFDFQFRTKARQNVNSSKSEEIKNTASSQSSPLSTKKSKNRYARKPLYEYGVSPNPTKSKEVKLKTDTFVNFMSNFCPSGLHVFINDSPSFNRKHQVMTSLKYCPRVTRKMAEFPLAQSCKLIELTILPLQMVEKYLKSNT